MLFVRWLYRIFVNSGFSIFGPVFAVFVTKQISGGSLEVIGFATAIFQIFKSGIADTDCKIFR